MVSHHQRFPGSSQVKDFATPHVLDLRRQLEHLWGLPQAQGKPEHSVPSVYQAISPEHIIAERLSFKVCPCLAWLAKTGKDVLKFRFLFFLGKINNRVIISFLKQGRETGTSQAGLVTGWRRRSQ